MGLACRRRIVRHPVVVPFYRDLPVTLEVGAFERACSLLVWVAGLDAPSPQLTPAWKEQNCSLFEHVSMFRRFRDAVCQGLQGDAAMAHVLDGVDRHFAAPTHLVVDAVRSWDRRVDGLAGRHLLVGTFSPIIAGHPAFRRPAARRYPHVVADGFLHVLAPRDVICWLGGWGVHDLVEAPAPDPLPEAWWSTVAALIGDGMYPDEAIAVTGTLLD